jgi:hypothetical protein
MGSKLGHTVVFLMHDAYTLDSFTFIYQGAMEYPSTFAPTFRVVSDDLIMQPLHSQCSQTRASEKRHRPKTRQRLAECLQ